MAERLSAQSLGGSCSVISQLSDFKHSCPCVSSGKNNGTYNRVVSEDYLTHVKHVEQCLAPQKVLTENEDGDGAGGGDRCSWVEQERHVSFTQEVGKGAAELVLLGRGRGFPLDGGLSTVGTVKVERRLF